MFNRVLAMKSFVISDIIERLISNEISFYHQLETCYIKDRRGEIAKLIFNNILVWLSSVCLQNKINNREIELTIDFFQTLITK